MDGVSKVSLTNPAAKVDRGVCVRVFYMHAQEENQMNKNQAHPRKAFCISIMITTLFCCCSMSILQAALLESSTNYSFNIDNMTDLTITVQLTNDTKKVTKPWSYSAYSRKSTSEERANWAIVDIYSEFGVCETQGFVLPYMLPKTEAAQLDVTKDENGQCFIKKRT